MIRREGSQRDASRQKLTHAPGDNSLKFQVAVSEAPVTEISVEPDHFDVVNSDVVLVARLTKGIGSTFGFTLKKA
jgi:hypothetical protein